MDDDPIDREEYEKAMGERTFTQQEVDAKVQADVLGWIKDIAEAAELDRDKIVNPEDLVSLIDGRVKVAVAGAYRRCAGHIVSDFGLKCADTRNRYITTFSSWADDLERLISELEAKEKK